MTAIVLTTIAVILRILANPLGNVFQKRLTARGHPPLWVNFCTYLGLSALCVIGALAVDWPPLSGTFWFYSVLGGVAGALGNGFLVRALQTGDLSLLGPINSYKSVVGILGGVVLLGEVPNLWGLAGVALIIWGSYFVLDTTEERFSWALLRRPEIRFRMGALVLTAIEAVFLKKIILASSPTLAFFSWCWWGALFSFVLWRLYPQGGKPKAGPLNATDSGTYGLLIACIGIMQLSTNYVFDHLQVGYALSLFQLSILVSVVLGHRIFGEKDLRKKLLGSAIMILGSVVIILLKGR